MSVLLIAAQDLRPLRLGLVENDVLLRETTADVPPEGYLNALDATLKEWKLTWRDFTAIAVVAGPGAFTASRVSTVLADTLAFVANCPVLALENPEKRPLAELAASLSKGAPKAFAVPVYNRPPNITKPSR